MRGSEARQHPAALFEQNAGAPPIGRCVKAGEFDGPGKTQPGLHRRRHKLALGVGGRDARHDFGVPDHQMIAALGFERDAIAEGGRERL